MRLKYSNARTSSWVTPSPAAYILPSFHCATGWPPSAAYCSEVNEGCVSEGCVVTAAAVVGGLTARFRAAAAPGWPATTGSGASALVGAPSKANPGAEGGTTPNSNARMIRLDVRITLFLVCATRMGNCAIHRRPNLLGIFPQGTRCMISRAGLPFGLAFSQFGVGQFYVKSADVGVDLDDVTVP